MASLLVALAGVSGFVGVAVGAFGAHALRRKLSPDNLTLLRTGVQYQLVHTLAILAAALLTYWTPSPLMAVAGWCFVAGIVLFSGSVYMLAMTGNRAFGPITPLGGLAFLAGWACLVVASFLMV